MEPSDVGPKYGGHLPVTEVDRAEAMTLLDAAKTHGYLSTDDYEHRALAVRSAANRDDLRPVTRDLANVTQSPATYSQIPTSYPVARPSGVAQESLVKVGFFSGATLAGKWDTPSQVHCYAAFGSVDIDFTVYVDASEPSLRGLGGCSTLSPSTMRMSGWFTVIFSPGTMSYTRWL